MPKRKTKVIPTPFEIISESLQRLEKESDEKQFEIISTIKPLIEDIKSKNETLVDTIKNMEKNTEKNMEKNMEQQKKLYESQALTQIQNFPKELEKLKADEKEWIARATDNQSVIERLNKEKNELLGKVEEQKKEIEKIVQNYVSQIEDLSGTILNVIDIKDKEITSLNNLIDKKNTLVQQTKNEFELTMNQLNGLKKEYGMLKTQYNHVVSDIQMMNDISETKVRELNKELQEKFQNINDLTQHLSQLQTLIKKSKCEIL